MSDTTSRSPDPAPPVPAGQPLVEELLRVMPRWASRYEYVQKLGQGGFGVALLARQVSLKRDVVVKILYRMDGEALTRFRREAEILSRVRHPNLVDLLDYDEEGEICYLVMSYVRGETLRDRMLRGPLPWQELVSIAQHVTSGLEVLHRERILHRDIKPGNILLDEDGTARLCDLGLGLYVDRSRITEAGTMLGTLAYASPEMLLDGDSEAASDLYSLGVVMYEALTGTNPFRGDCLEMTYLNQTTLRVKELPPACTAPAELEQLIIEMLRKEKDQRPTSAGEVLERLSAVVAGETGPDSRDAPPTQALPGVISVTMKPAPRSKDGRTRRVQEPATAPPRTRRREALAGVLIGGLTVLAWSVFRGHEGVDAAAAPGRPGSPSPAVASASASAATDEDEQQKLLAEMRAALDGPGRLQFVAMAFRDQVGAESTRQTLDGVRRQRPSLRYEAVAGGPPKPAVTYFTASFVPFLDARIRALQAVEVRQKARRGALDRERPRDVKAYVDGILFRDRGLRDEFFRVPPPIAGFSRDLLVEMRARAAQPKDGWVVERLFRLWASLLYLLHRMDAGFPRSGAILERTVNEVLPDPQDPRLRLAVLLFKVLRTGRPILDHGITLEALERLTGDDHVEPSVWRQTLGSLVASDPCQQPPGIAEDACFALPVIWPSPFIGPSKGPRPSPPVASPMPRTP